MTAKDAWADSHATEQMVSLFDNVLRLSEEPVLFVHQHTTEYGHGWSDSPRRSVVKSVVGSHLADVGVELNDLSAQAIACAAEKELLIFTSGAQA